MISSPWLLWMVVQANVDRLIYGALGSRYSVILFSNTPLHPDGVIIHLRKDQTEVLYQLALPYEIDRGRDETDTDVVSRLSASLFETLSDFDGGASKRKLVQPVSPVYGLAAQIDGGE